MKAPWRVRKGYQTYSDELFREHREHLAMYLEETWSVADHDNVIEEFEENPHAGLIIVNDFINNRDDPEINREKLFNLIKQPETGVILISGSKGSGKSYFAFDIIDEMAKFYRPVWVGAPITLPDWIGYAPDISSLKAGDLAIIDEGGAIISSRRSMSNQNVEITQRFQTLRHAKVKVVVITQSTKRVDVAVIEFADIHITKEYSAVYGQKTERFDEDIFDKYLNVGMKEWNFVRSSSFMGNVLGKELDWYDSVIGTPYSLFDNIHDAKKYFISMVDAGNEANFIKTQLNMKGCKKNKKEIEALITRYNKNGTLDQISERNRLIKAGVKNPDAILATA